MENKNTNTIDAYSSTDGKNWTSTSISPGTRFVASTFNEASNEFVASILKVPNYEIHTSTDGVNWTKKGNIADMADFGASEPTKSLIYDDATNTLSFLMQDVNNSNKGTMFTSTDGGTTWSQKTVSPSQRYIDVLATDGNGNMVSFDSDNGNLVLGKSYADTTLPIQAGANSNQKIDITLSAMNTKALGVNDIIVNPAKAAGNAITKIDNAINKVSEQRAVFGATQNRLEYAFSNVSNNAQNTQYAESRIRDTDMAATTIQFTRNQLLTKSAQEMLAQAIQQPKAVLEVLR